MLFPLLCSLLLPFSLVNAVPPYSTWMTDSILSAPPTLGFTYEAAVFERGLRAVYAKTNNTKYINARTAAINAIIDVKSCPVSGLRTMTCDYRNTYFSLDDIRIGVELLELYKETGAAKYWTWIQVLRNQLNRQPRNPAGGYWHRSTYPNQMWLDGIFMAQPFYAQYTSLYDAANTTAWNDIIKQFDLIEANCHYKVANQSGLLVHGYDSSKVAVWADPVNGAAPLVWDRAMGWYAMALVDVLDYFPASHPGRARLLRYLTSLADAIKKSQDVSGGWWLIMNSPYPGQKGNYIESSTGAMFTFALLKAFRLGYLSRTTYGGVAEKAYALMTKKFAVVRSNDILSWEGTVSVGSLGSDATFAYYTSVATRTNDLKGVGSFIVASYEWELYHGV